ncbi:GMC family oxidoreductase [Rhizobium beringeri]
MDTDAGPQGCMLYSLQFYRSQETGHKLGYMMHALRGTGPVETAMSALGKRKLRFGRDIYGDFDALYGKQLVVAIICEDLPEVENRIELDETRQDRFGDPGIKVHYKLHENTKKMMVHGMTRGRELMAAAGAVRSSAYGPVRNTGWHLLGTARMGDDPQHSVVDPSGKVHDTDNLYVIDSSVFVTGSCVNPANTIQAVALLLRIASMNVSDRPSYKLLARMLPGEPERSVPAFDAIAAARLGERFAGLDEIDALILKETEAAWPEDVNVLLKALRSGAPDLVDHFTEQAVVLYFSTPAVSRALTGKPVPLFPEPDRHGRHRL